MKIFICPDCGTEFITNRTDKRYCSRKCQKANSYIKNHSYVCKNCGKEYKTAYRNRDKYCSRECSDNHVKKQNCECCGKEFIAKIQRKQRFCSRKCQRIYRERDDNHRSIIQCIVCGIQFMQTGNGKKTCSDKCRKIYARQRSLGDYLVQYQSRTCICTECGREFSTEYLNKHRTFCSDKCGKKYGSRIGKASRRARIYGAKRIEYFDPFYIFKRDKWHCQLCGVKTPKRLRGTIEDRAPELDHIIPLALGGEHTIVNTQCLCRKCNQDKGATIAGQLRMF